TPVRMFYFIFSPLPWRWRGLTDVITSFFSGLFYGYTLYLGIRHLFHKNAKNKNLTFISLFTVMGGIMVFSWRVSNAGTSLRHRDKFIGLFILLLAITMNEMNFAQLES